MFEISCSLNLFNFSQLERSPINYVFFVILELKKSLKEFESLHFYKKSTVPVLPTERKTGKIEGIVVDPLGLQLAGSQIWNMMRKYGLPLSFHTISNTTYIKN